MEKDMMADKDDVVDPSEVVVQGTEAEQDPVVHQVDGGEAEKTEDDELKAAKREARSLKAREKKLKAEIERLQRSDEETRSLVHQLISNQKQEKEVAEVSRASQEIEGYYQNSRVKFAQALKTGNPELIEQASAEMIDATDRKNKLADYVAAQKQRPVQPQREAKPRRESRATKRWKDAHAWYDDPEYEYETSVVHFLDSGMANDPEWRDEIGSPDYMDELTDRMKSDRRLKKILEENDRDAEPRQARGRQTVVGSSRGREGSKPRIDPRIIEAAREIGKPVDDPKFLERLQKFAGAR